jgi:hypothetical protein
MVRKHYEKLGFTLVAPSETEDLWSLDLSNYEPFATFIAIKETP